MLYHYTLILWGGGKLSHATQKIVKGVSVINIINIGLSKKGLYQRNEGAVYWIFY